jgi:ATP-dependent DNA helicase RecQ
MHPARRALAGKPEGALFDRLVAVQLRLQRGADGTEKPLSCSTAQIKRIAESRPSGREALARHLDEPRLERFAQAFLDEIAAAG